MRILVTGLNGFTGQYVQSALLTKGHEVIPLHSDITDAQSVIDELANTPLDAVIHLAAIAFVAHGKVNDIYKVNLLGTRNLLDALANTQTALKHILIASSANIYGNSSAGILDEQTPANPANDYALSKYAMELMTGFWHHRLPITLVRPFNYTGIGQNKVFLIPKIIEHFKTRKKVIELGNLEVWREFNDVRFVADCYAQLITLSSQISGQTINICTGHAYSLQQVIELCADITGHKIEIQVNPAFIRENEVRELKGNNAYLQQILGTGQQYDLKQTLIWMLATS